MPGRIVRVAWDGDRAVCFGDGPLADFADGEHVFVDGHIVAEGGPELADRLEVDGYDRFVKAAKVDA